MRWSFRTTDDDNRRRDSEAETDDARVHLRVLAQELERSIDRLERVISRMERGEQ